MTVQNQTRFTLCLNPVSHFQKISALYAISTIFNKQNLIESSQETAGRRLSLYINNPNQSWSSLPRIYKIFGNITNSFSIQFLQYYKRFLTRRYTDYQQSCTYTCPYTGKQIELPPCFITPEQANPEFSRESQFHQEFVQPFVPSAVTLENLLLDEIVLMDQCESVEALIERLKKNPFLHYDNEETFHNVSYFRGIIDKQAIRRIVWFLLSKGDPRFNDLLNRIFKK